MRDRALHILIVEDEPLLRRELKVLLENASYQVTAVEHFDTVVQQVDLCKPDLVLLDVMLPGISGFDICTQIRERQQVPVIFLTSRTDSMDELTGILKGGDDYIVKPYQAPVLLARIAAVLKRTGSLRQTGESRMTHKGVELDVSKCCVSYQDRCAELTKNEMKLLHVLFLHAGEFVQRTDIIEYLWENAVFIDDNTLSVHITRVRDKLKSIGVFDFIETRRGIGYRI